MRQILAENHRCWSTAPAGASKNSFANKIDWVNPVFSFFDACVIVSTRRITFSCPGERHGNADSSRRQSPHLGENIESDLASRFLRVVEVAAIASARTMGQGERKLSDQVATEAMRKTMDSIPMRGTIVIGEGERDEAPMLYIGEKVGAEFPDGTEVPEVDIAVDPLEGTNLCAPARPARSPCWRLPSAEAC